MPLVVQPAAAGSLPYVNLGFLTADEPRVSDTEEQKDREGKLVVFVKH